MTQILPNNGIWWNRAKVPITGSLFDEAILKPEHPEEIRIQRLRNRVFRERSTRISIERAKLATASYRSSEGHPPMIQRAKAIAHVFREIPISIEEDELLVGRPGAFPAGAEIDPEFHSTWLAGEVSINGTEMREIDALTSRDYERYSIDPGDKQAFTEDILPYWFNRTHQSHILNELETCYPDALTYLQNTKAHLPLLGTGVCHTVQDYLSVIEKGIQSLKEEISGRMKTIDPAKPEDLEFHSQMICYRAMLIVADAVIDHSQRYAVHAQALAERESDPRRAAELREIAGICARIPRYPAKTFREAIQSRPTISARKV